MGRQHVSMDEAPENDCIFTRACGGTKTKPKSASAQQSPVAQAVTEAATVLTSALAPIG